MRRAVCQYSPTNDRMNERTNGESTSEENGTETETAAREERKEAMKAPPEQEKTMIVGRARLRPRHSQKPGETGM